MGGLPDYTWKPLMSKIRHAALRRPIERFQSAPRYRDSFLTPCPKYGLVRHCAERPEADA